MYIPYKNEIKTITPNNIYTFAFHLLCTYHYLLVNQLFPSKVTLIFHRFFLKELAKSTIGVTQDHQLFKLKTSISYVEELNQDIEETENQIITLMDRYPTKVQTIKGIGIISAAVILCEYGDITLFFKPR